MRDGAVVASQDLEVIGRIVNNYEIKARIGEGGMGTVYLAQHPFLGRKAAIKVLRKIHQEDESMIARFMNEARAANAIHHPNIIEIIDVGRLPDGPPYLMMEYLDGETLGARLARLGRLPIAQALQFIQQAVDALEATHATGIIHRDLKPENLFLIADPSTPGGEHLKVLDFGVAKLRAFASAESVRTTGVILGTPLYMSPEQCRGLEIDHRADIYAVGAILYEALCGKPPFVGEAQIDVMMMQVTRRPTSPREINPELSESLDAVILRALAKRPEDRFASMAELHAALGAELAAGGGAGEGPVRKSTPPVAAISPPRRRLGRPLVWAMGASLLGVAATYLLLSMGDAPKPKKPSGTTIVAAPVPAPPPPAATNVAQAPPVAEAPVAGDAAGAAARETGATASQRPAKADPRPKRRGGSVRAARTAPLKIASPPAPAPSPPPAATPPPPAWMEKW